MLTDRLPLTERLHARSATCSIARLYASLFSHIHGLLYLYRLFQVIRRCAFLRFGPTWRLHTHGDAGGVIGGSLRSPVASSGCENMLSRKTKEKCFNVTKTFAVFYNADNSLVMQTKISNCTVLRNILFLRFRTNRGKISPVTEGLTLRSTCRRQYELYMPVFYLSYVLLSCDGSLWLANSAREITKRTRGLQHARSVRAPHSSSKFS